MKTLEHKRVLFLCPRFYTYTELLINCLSELGLDVTFYENKMFPSDLNCSINKISSCLHKIKNPREKKQYEEKILEECKDKKFDILFSINAFIISENLVNSIKKINPKIKTILFLWDSLSYWKYSKTLHLFDKVYSFDHYDCKRYGLTYHPDFILGITPIIDHKYHYKVVHIGSVSIFSSHRIPILAKLKQICQNHRISNYITIVTNIGEEWERNKIKTLYKCITSNKYRVLLWRYLKYKDSDIFTNIKLPLSEVNQIENSAELIVDIPPLKQQGCTIRSLEALNRGQKVLTTNTSIEEEDFYDRDMIHIIKNNQYNIDDILEMPNKRINLNKLLLKNWCISILEG